jgi:ubiquinone/menaquinone biosynthesis C-methylase UbiE
MMRRLERASFPLSQVPPRDLRLHISPAWFDFRATGRDQMEFLVQMAGLQPSDSVLDVACGVGRIAFPLRRFLDSRGRYSGFDVFAEGIEWCREKIAAKDSRFDFMVANVRTDFHSEGADARDYRFEYGDATFDFCYAGSIFTHLVKAEAENYLRQVHRVLRQGGRFVSTWLTYSNDSIAFRNESSPGESVAYEQGQIRALYREAGLRIIEPFRPDASYNLARIPKVRAMGIHLHHCVSIVAVADGLR